MIDALGQRTTYLSNSQGQLQATINPLGLVITDQFVPNDLVTDVDGTGMRVDTPLFRLPVRSRLAFNKVGVGTGIARAALVAFEVHDRQQLTSSDDRRPGSANLSHTSCATDRAVARAYATDRRSGRVPASR